MVDDAQANVTCDPPQTLVMHDAAAASTLARALDGGRQLTEEEMRQQLQGFLLDEGD